MKIFYQIKKIKLKLLSTRCQSLNLYEKYFKTQLLNFLNFKSNLVKN